jgi:hypothetical protein
MDIQKNNANERAEESPMAGSGSEMAAVMTTQPQHGRRMRRLGRAWRALGVAAIAGGSMVMASCHSAVTEGRSSVYLIMESLEGGSGFDGQEADFFHTLESDVATNNGGVFEDPGRVRMRIAFKDVTNPNAPTTNNFVTINRYRVEYRRADGRNRQGLDVPYAFDGASTFTVTDSATEGGFVLVRVQAKLEQPLITLVGVRGGGLVISTLADVTFYGRDQTGTEVSVKGTISVNFADWADPES